jgi:hypothetical protein
MNKDVIKKLAHGWYMGEMPSAAEAAAHFRMCASRDPLHSLEYGEALAMFLRDRMFRHQRPPEPAPGPDDTD